MKSILIPLLILGSLKVALAQEVRADLKVSLDQVSQILGAQFDGASASESDFDAAQIEGVKLPRSSQIYGKGDRTWMASFEGDEPRLKMITDYRVAMRKLDGSPEVKKEVVVLRAENIATKLGFSGLKVQELRRKQIVLDGIPADCYQVNLSEMPEGLPTMAGRGIRGQFDARDGQMISLMVTYEATYDNQPIRVSADDAAEIATSATKKLGLEGVIVRNGLLWHRTGPEGAHFPSHYRAYHVAIKCDNGRLLSYYIDAGNGDIVTMDEAKSAPSRRGNRGTQPTTVRQVSSTPPSPQQAPKPKAYEDASFNWTAIGLGTAMFLGIGIWKFRKA